MPYRNGARLHIERQLHRILDDISELSAILGPAVIQEIVVLLPAEHDALDPI